jgi:two-component system nitrate/nitrite response regulator NarL
MMENLEWKPRNDKLEYAFAADYLYLRIPLKHLVPEMNTATLLNFTSREAQVALHLAQGRPNKEIASNLGITERTVKFHVGQIFIKLAVDNRIDASRRLASLQS